MKKLSPAFIWGGLIIAVIGGISRIICVPFMVDSRVWAGAAAILLLASIAINTLPKES